MRRKFERRSLTAQAAVVAVSILTSAAMPVAAQTYPSRPMHMIVGFPVGGGSDAFARVLGERLGDLMGQQVIVDNRPGANGNIGAEVAARLPADGYNTLVVSTSQAINASLYTNLNYDLTKSFTAVALIGSVPNTVVVKADLPAKNIKDLIQLAKSRRLTYASSGVGSPEHLAGELFCRQAGIEMVHVPYKGSGQSATDLAGGHVDSGFNTLPSVIGLAKQGRVKVLAVTTKERTLTNPDIPTVSESGLPKYEMSTWYALVVPSGTPGEVVKRLSEEVNKAIGGAEIKARLNAIGADAAEPNTPAQASAFIESEIAKYRAIVREAGIKPE